MMPEDRRHAGAEEPVLSAAHLARFLACAHALHRDLAAPEASAHSADPAMSVTAARARLRAGAAQVKGLTLGAAGWCATPQMLERCDGSSDLGAFHYQVVDPYPVAALRPERVLHLVICSDLLAKLQGVPPAQAVWTDQDGVRQALRLADYADYVRRAQARLRMSLHAQTPPRAEPCAACGDCRWAAACAQDWRQDDSLFTLAGIRRAQVARLEAAGISTVAGLAARDTSVPGLAEATRARLSTQARLQQAAAAGGQAWALRPARAEQGLALLPALAPGDVIHVFEETPGGTGGRHGFWQHGAYTSLDAQTADGMAASLAAVFERLSATLAADPGAHVYHYGASTITALKRQSMSHGIGEAALDHLLRARRFVDLQAVLRGAVITTLPTESPEALAPLFGGMETCRGARSVRRGADRSARLAGALAPRGRCRRGGGFS